MGFNPRSPRGGATIKFVKSSIVLILFQSTLPTRGSDFNFRSFFKPDYGFNPRSPRGGATVAAPPPWAGLWGFNPRSPRGGATWARSAHIDAERRFQSTLPTRGSDALYPRRRQNVVGVSIHAPHEGERPLQGTTGTPMATYVSIHAPHEGERRCTCRRIGQRL